MSDKDDYRRTALAMIKDARTLRSSGSYRNACYLAGYVVECSLKALIEATRHRPVRSHDLVQLSEQIAKLSLAAGQVVARYGDPLTFAPTITRRLAHRRDSRGVPRSYFWDPHHRYDGSRWTEPTTAEAYIKEAEKALQIMDQMFLDGVFR